MILPHGWPASSQKLMLVPNSSEFHFVVEYRSDQVCVRSCRGLAEHLSASYLYSMAGSAAVKALAMLSYVKQQTISKPNIASKHNLSC